MRVARLMSLKRMRCPGIGSRISWLIHRYSVSRLKSYLVVNIMVKNSGDRKGIFRILKLASRVVTGTTVKNSVNIMIIFKSSRPRFRLSNLTWTNVIHPTVEKSMTDKISSVHMKHKIKSSRVISRTYSFR